MLQMTTGKGNGGSAFLRAAVVLMLGSAGCAWPAATRISGQAEIELSGQHPGRSLPDSQTGAVRLIVVKFWRQQELFGTERMKFEFFGPEALDQASFSVSFPVRFYPAVRAPVCPTRNLVYLLDRAPHLHIPALPSPWSVAEGTGQSGRRQPAPSFC